MRYLITPRPSPAQKEIFNRLLYNAPDSFTAIQKAEKYFPIFSWVSQQMSYPCGYVLESYPIPKTAMQKFSPGDRVVAIDTKLNGPRVLPNHLLEKCSFHFPDGPLQAGKVYHVYDCIETGNGTQGLYLTGLRVFLDKSEISWCSSRFRKVAAAGHPKIDHHSKSDSTSPTQDSDSTLGT